MTKRVIEHEVKLEKSVKIILATLAFGVLAHAFVPTFSVTSALAKKHVSGSLQKLPLSVYVKGPVRLTGNLKLGLDGKLGLGGGLSLSGALKCDGCAPTQN